MKNHNLYNERTLKMMKASFKFLKKLFCRSQDIFIQNFVRRNALGTRLVTYDVIRKF